MDGNDRKQFQLWFETSSSETFDFHRLFIFLKHRYLIFQLGYVCVILLDQHASVVLRGFQLENLSIQPTFIQLLFSFQQFCF